MTAHFNLILCDFCLCSFPSTLLFCLDFMSWVVPFFCRQHVCLHWTQSYYSLNLGITYSSIKFLINISYRVDLKTKMVRDNGIYF